MNGDSNCCYLLWPLMNGGVKSCKGENKKKKLDKINSFFYSYPVLTYVLHVYFNRYYRLDISDNEFGHKLERLSLSISALPMTNALKMRIIVRSETKSSLKHVHLILPITSLWMHKRLLTC